MDRNELINRLVSRKLAANGAEKAASLCYSSTRQRDSFCFASVTPTRGGRQAAKK